MPTPKTCNQSKQGGCTCTPDLFEEEDRDLSHLPSTYPAGRGQIVHHLPTLPAPVGLLPHGGHRRPSSVSVYPGLDRAPDWCAYLNATPDEIRAACAVLNIDPATYGLSPEEPTA